MAAFRQGLGLAGLAVIQSPEGTRLAAVGSDGVGSLPAGESGEVRFWCRHAADAERIVATAKSKLRRHSLDSASRATPHLVSSCPSEADEALMTSATRLHVALYSNEEIICEAMAAIARMEEELEFMQRAGALRSVNQSYRIYRQESSARGEKIGPYAQWFRAYKENLVRQIAAALRYF